MKRIRKGFTLAELLIVVAIIAVLVGISIPIFTTQLEKSREAVDLANVRAAYAVLVTSVMSDSTTSVDDISVDGDRFYTIVPLSQAVNGWQSSLPLTIADISSDNAAQWVGVPEAGGSCRIEYDSRNDDYTSALTFYWNAEGGSGSTSAEHEDSADADPAVPTPSDPVTPPGTPEEDLGEDPGESPGTEVAGVDPALMQSLVESAKPYPAEGAKKYISKGDLYNYNGTIYVALEDIYISPYYRITPDSSDGQSWGFVELSSAATVYDTPGHYEGSIKKGTLYVVGDDIFVRTRDENSWWWDPTQDFDPRNWQAINR